MLWCFPINFRKKTERTFDSSVLVAPEEMHPTHSADHANDYGGNYLVPNRRGQGQGKPVVKRPPPPSTSRPLDDDFDVITQTQTGATTTRGGPETEWGTRVQESAVTRTSSPLPDDFDAATNTVVTPGPQRYTPAGSYWDQRQQQQQQQNRQKGHMYSHSMPVNGAKTYNHQGAAHVNAKPKGEFEHYGEYGRYMDEMGRMFGGGGEVEVTAKKVGADVERRESRQIGRVPQIRTLEGAIRGASFRWEIPGLSVGLRSLYLPITDSADVVQSLDKNTRWSIGGLWRILQKERSLLLHGESKLRGRQTRMLRG
ncbi:hypothetical protein BDQ17DRAFT_401816 [Cyathus striatus]|nr:hypothetical protein BDQ17DRAFT_401816 [Cyathus striatus]